VANILHRERIERSILLLRGQKVMLDHDLAELYGVEIKYLKKTGQEKSGSLSGGFHV